MTLSDTPPSNSLAVGRHFLRLRVFHAPFLVALPGFRLDGDKL
jgi:hypothetical protein